MGLRFPKGSSLQMFTPILVAPVPASLDFYLDSENNLRYPPKGPDWQEWHKLASPTPGRAE